MSVFLAGYDRESGDQAELRILSPVGGVVPGIAQRIDATSFVRAYLQNRARCRAFELLVYPALAGVSFDFIGDETRLEAWRKLLDALVRWSSGPTFAGWSGMWSYFAGELTLYEAIWVPPGIHRIMVNYDWSAVEIVGGLQYGPIATG